VETLRSLLVSSKKDEVMFEPKRGRDDGDSKHLTTNHGVRVNDNQNSLTAGERGPTLMEDFIFREKLTHFDHERIPERIVHARGSAAHGYFESYADHSDITSAHFLGTKGRRTPVFVRFSTVVGSRGSADTVRDVRGFATKFYTEQGNFDLVGNNIPVFFIQDGMKFPDLVHAIKPEPHHEMPQASAAHDNFWDFISLMPESMHMILWVLSDRALPRSYAMMDGFGVHTFRLVDAEGRSRFIKWHWRPSLGTHALAWDETQKIAGKDPDFNRRDLWERIEKGAFPEYELSVQVIDEQDQARFDFDLLDATKIVPEELVPRRPLGKMVLDRNPDNFFAETEQAAFHPGHLVPGIDFSDDPLLQARLFSYLDTQLIRLGGPNFHELPINRPTGPVHNNQRGGSMRHSVDKGRVNYEPNSLAGGCPMQSPASAAAFVSHAQQVHGPKLRKRPESFADHFSQATLFWNSLSASEKQHLVEAAHFELGKVETISIRERMVELFNQVDHELAQRVAADIGVALPAQPAKPNHGRSSPALSMENTVKDSIRTRKIVVLVADGFDGRQVEVMRKALEARGAQIEVVSKRLGKVTPAGGGPGVHVDNSYLTTGSILYDALFVPGGAQHAATLCRQGDAIQFVNEMYRHCKPIAATGEGARLLAEARLEGVQLPGANVAVNEPFVQDGVVVARADQDASAQFILAIAQHRHWGRQLKEMTPA
jgi:catalase